MKVTLVSGFYPWAVDMRKRDLDVEENLDQVFAALSAAGIAGWEPNLTPDEALITSLVDKLPQHGLVMPSAYANIRLHDSEADENIARWVSVAPALKAAGLRYLEVNPVPIEWGQPFDKDDTQLRHQAVRLERLGFQMLSAGIELCYHTHDPEMRQGAREFHHMLQVTDPMAVGFNIDPHWIYRGCGNSMVALEDILDMYGDRIRTVHLRQSVGGTWSETLGEGDIDHEPIIDVLKAIEFDGVLVLEQAAEDGTPETMTMAEREKQNADWVRKVFEV